MLLPPHVLQEQPAQKQKPIVYLQLPKHQIQHVEHIYLDVSSMERIIVPKEIAHHILELRHNVVQLQQH